jgi:aryl-alcohol dehydrogenase-like predicted oxidoreductase
MKENKLVLGTAQLGLNYGIANKTGKPEENKAFEIMKYAVENGISYFDTAYSYGNSEIIIGKFLNIHKAYKNKINIITKMAPLKKKKLNEKNVNNRFFKSLHRLGQESIYCYMIHDFKDIENNCDEIGKIFLKLKENGYIKKVGVSVYDNFQLIFLLNNFNFDLIQLPISIFDQRLITDNSLLELKKKNIEIYARSIFLQGSLFIEENNLPPKMNKFKDHILRLNEISLKYNLLKEEIALLFVNAINEIDKIIIGVEKIDQLQKNIRILSKSENFNKIKTLINFKDFFIEDTNIIDPRRW